MTSNREGPTVLAMTDVAPDDTLIDISAAAAALTCSVRTVARLQSDGRLEPVYEHTLRGARRRRFRRADVEALKVSA